MDRFAQFTFSTLARDASFVALTATVLMVGFSYDPPLALHVGGQTALIFCLYLMHRASRLSMQAVVRSEAWRALSPHERPRDEPGRLVAYRHLRDGILRFAKGAAGLACLLLFGSLAASLA